MRKMFNKDIRKRQKLVIVMAGGVIYEFLTIARKYNLEIPVIRLSISEIFAVMRLLKQTSLHFLYIKCIKPHY